ncbi:MAG: PilZ domain-containing protein [Planctomycetes bacterium]|nr:PilZ domain-containing protein [Planctomycetota bacterium]
MGDTTHIAKAYHGRQQLARKARIKVDLWCQLLGSRDRAVGHIRNLTVGGCRILSPSAFPVRETFSLVLAGSASGPDLHLKAQLRWLALNPEEGPFELGCQFVHSGDSARQVEGLLKGVIKKAPKSEDRRAASYAKFGGGLDAVRSPGAPGAGDLRRVFAAEGLDLLTRPGPSAPLP